MAIGRYFESSYPYISPYIDITLPPLTAIAQAIYASTPVTHFRQGFQQFYRGLNLWEEAKETRDLLVQSLYSNTVEYLLPVIMYRRFMMVVTEKYSPDATDALLNVLDNTILLLFFIRLYQRRLADNIFNSISLTRAISNDVTEHLLELASEGFSENITELLLAVLTLDSSATTMLKDDIQFKLRLGGFEKRFAAVFDVAISARQLLKAYIKVSFRIELEKFFAESKVTADIFAGIIEPLQLVIKDKIIKYFSNVPAEERVNNFSHIVATILADQMASVFSPAYKNKLALDQSELVALLSQSLYLSVAKSVAEKYLQNVEKTGEKIKLFLPVKTDPICGCELKKQLHGGISSQVYYAANQFYTTIPTLMLKSGHLSLDTYSYFDIPMQMIAIWLYGQCFNELKVSTDGSCTRHRYLEFARNKAHSFGLGLAYYLTLHTLIRAVYLTTEVDNFFTRDALSNLLMQFVTVSMLIHNDRLPGKKDFPWDWFYWPREVTLKIVNTLQYLFQRHPDDKEKRNNVLINIQSVLLSQYFGYGIDLIFSGTDLYPRPELLEMKKGLFLLSEVQDPRRVLLNIPSFHRLIRLYKKDIEIVIEKLKGVHKNSTWVPKWLVSCMSNPFLPLPGIIALIIDVLQLMKDENWEALIKHHELELFVALYHKPLDVSEAIVQSVTEQAGEIIVNDQPVEALNIRETHISLTEEKISEVKPTIVMTHAEIINFDFGAVDAVLKVVEPEALEDEVIVLDGDDDESRTSSPDNKFDSALPNDIRLDAARSEPTVANSMGSLFLYNDYVDSRSASTPAAVTRLTQRRTSPTNSYLMGSAKLPMANTIAHLSLWTAGALNEQVQTAYDAISTVLPTTLNTIPPVEVELRATKKM